MPRHAMLGKKNGHWFTKAGNPNGVYFGAVGVVMHKQAKEKFAAHLKAIGGERTRRASGVNVTTLVERFLDWVKEHRSDRTYGERRLHLERFANLKIGEALVGDLVATAIRAEDVQAFLTHAKAEHKLDDFTTGKHHTSIGACFAWGAGKKNPSPCLPRDFHPFSGMERHKRPPEPLLEGELPAPGELVALFKHADDDLAVVAEPGRFRMRRPDEFRQDHPYRGFRDMLTVFHQTGARTSELADARVSHFVKSAKQIVLGKHKRSNTMKDTAARRITLADEAFKIVAALCDGKQPTEAIFTDQKGRPWNRLTLVHRFEQVRTRAGVRPDITLYSFRHLWISEALMEGIDVATVAKMAGTSIAMIEKVYGHFTNQHFADAQDKLEQARKVRASTAA